MKADATFPVFETTQRQAEIALACLGKAAIKIRQGQASEDSLLPYLIHSVVLLFLVRDQAAFMKIAQSQAYEALRLEERLRQLPTLNQLQAVLRARQGDPEWQQLAPQALQAIDSLDRYTDESLGVVELKRFRDQLLINGVPTVEPQTRPFATPGFNEAQLIDQTLTGWQRLLGQ